MRACETKKITGSIHSLETFGTHDGPGIRFVVFLQGCLGRCLYCQNPDTWQEGAGKPMSAEDLAERVEKCLPYITASRGGVTVSGGEPLLQTDFVREFFSLCKENGVHTAIDTSAFFRPEDEPRLASLLPLTDLFIVDIKAVREELHRRIASQELAQVKRFIAFLEEAKKEYWLRYVLVPGLNDAEGDLRKLGGFLRGLTYCRHFEFLAYHTLGKHKWEHLGLSYPLQAARPATAEDVQRAEQLIAG